MNVFGAKVPSKGVQSWSQLFDLTSPGGGCNGLISLYGSLGDKTLIGAHTIDTVMDGPERVVCYDNLTLGDGATATSLTSSQRCKGLTVIVKGDLRIKANATLNMTLKGPYVVASNLPFFPFVDFKIPKTVSISSGQMSQSAALAMIKSAGYAVWDRGTWDVFGSLLGVQCSVIVSGGTTLIPVASLCAATSIGCDFYAEYFTGYPGNVGYNGSPGGGGSGFWLGNGNTNVYPARGGGATPYGGGAGGSGNHQRAGSDAYSVGGPGIYSMPSFGGVYSPYAGYAGGGKLTVICKGNITIDSGGKIESNGYSAGNYGGAGGGHISIIYGGPFTNNGTVQCAGGSGSATGGVMGNATGGAGGAGSVVTKTFAQMGW